MSIISRVKQVFSAPVNVEIFNRTDQPLTVDSIYGPSIKVAPHDGTTVRLSDGMRLRVSDEGVMMQKPPFPSEGGMGIN